MTSKEIQEQLNKFSIKEKKEFFPLFFKTGKGEYGEGDLFLGITVPDTRRIAKKYKLLPITEVKDLLYNPYHECRLCALLILCEKFIKEKTKIKQKEIYDFYLLHSHRINNWDLVDSSATIIVGGYLADKTDRNILYTLAKSSLLWKQRISIIATLAFIRKNDFKDTLQLAELYLTHKHDLIHKATGWMLREVGKRDKQILISFLNHYSSVMPRTMLRYSIEKLNSEEKAYYMKRK